MFDTRAVLSGACSLTAAAVLVACSSGGTTGASATTAPPSTATTATETTTAPEPITAEEEEWVRALHKLQKQLEKTVFRSGVVTERQLLSDAKVYDGCRKSLAKAPTARFSQPYEIAKKACRQLHEAAAQLRTAAANLDSSGAVIAGTAEEDNFNRAFKRGNALTGNAVNKMSRAVAKADAVRDRLPS